MGTSDMKVHLVLFAAGLCVVASQHEVVPEAEFNDDLFPDAKPADLTTAADIMTQPIDPSQIKDPNEADILLAISNGVKPLDAACTDKAPLWPRPPQRAFWNSRLSPN